MRRFECRHQPLIDGVIGNAVHPHLAGAPALRRGPLDAMIDVLRLAHAERLEIAGRTAGAAQIDAHARIAVRHPFLRIDDFPVLVFAAGARRDVGMLRDHLLPAGRVAVLEGKPFPIRAVAENDRVASLGDRAEHVGAQHETVVHDNRQIPVDAHAVAHLAAGDVRFRGFDRAHDGIHQAFSSLVRKHIAPNAGTPHDAQRSNSIFLNLIAGKTFPALPKLYRQAVAQCAREA